MDLEHLFVQVLEGSVDQSEQAFLSDEQVSKGFCRLAVQKPL